MHGVQRVVKYFAVALAFFIMAAIVSGIMFAASTIGFIVGREASNHKDVTEVVQDSMALKKVKELKIDVSAARLRLEDADELTVKSSSEDIKAYVQGEVLYVEESFGWWDFKDENEIIITLPRDHEFEKAKLVLGAGKVEIESLRAEELFLEVGAGSAKVKELIAERKSEIKGGAGYLEINGGSLQNLKLDMGVGKVAMTTELLGNSDLDAGVGRLEIELLGSKEDYTIAVDNGLGAIRMNGEDLSDDRVYGSGRNKVKIDGGVGSIEINTSGE